MRTITLRYAGDCRACGATRPVGSHAIYERRVGIFCPECAPTAPEAIREYRQEAANRRADKYDEWAEKRRQKANATIEHNRIYTGDIAFNTQPGHIPLRARIIKQNDRAFESLATARRFQEKAPGIRRVRVAGDAERKRQAVRDAVREHLRVGMEVETAWFGRGIVEKINRKTARIGSTGTSGTYSTNVDLSHISLLLKRKTQ